YCAALTTVRCAGQFSSVRRIRQGPSSSPSGRDRRPGRQGDSAVFNVSGTARSPSPAASHLGNPMSVANIDKAKIVADYRRSDNDTGSPEVQVALLTARIVELT